MEEIAAYLYHYAEKIRKCWMIDIQVSQHGENSLCNDLYFDKKQKMVRWLRNSLWVDETDIHEILSVDFREDSESITAALTVSGGWVCIKGIK